MKTILLVVGIVLMSACVSNLPAKKEVCNSCQQQFLPTNQEGQTRADPDCPSSQNGYDQYYQRWSK